MAKEKTDLEVFEEFVDWFYELVWGEPRRPKKATKPKRARTSKGKYIADIKATKEINEAWEGGKAPPKKTTTRKRKTKA